MDRMQFIGQTYQGFTSSVDDIVNFFDHTMAAYEIVGEKPVANVHGVTDIVNQTLVIKATIKDENELQEVVNNINNTLHNRKEVYGRSFYVDAHTKGPYIELSVHEYY